MNIVILHCHYERGGVTQVVENHVRALRERGEVDRILLVAGDRVLGLSDATRDTVELIPLDDFDYDAEPCPADRLQPRVEANFERLQQRLRARGLQPDDTVLHWHNHSLGKNTAAPGVIRQLAASGWRLLLQIHDFAEDHRPPNYARLISATGAADQAALDRYLYPVAAQIHYGTLTRTDAAVLDGLGIPSDRIACLPNSVVAPEAVVAASQQEARGEALCRLRQSLQLPTNARWCLYPVRGIRRKNVGELLLISQMMPEDRYCGLTLCPATPVERHSYERWRSVARELAPRVVFDAGQHPDVSFLTNLLASDFIVSTSVAEGFGMAFLEPWLLHREVIARRLEEVATDFEASGMQLERFYDSIPVPGDPAWLRRCRSQFLAAAENAWRRVPPAFHPSFELELKAGDAVDFAQLIPDEQVAVLKRVSMDAGFRQQVFDRSASLVDHLNAPCDPTLVARNAEVVKQTYSLSDTSERLMSEYRQLLAAPLDCDVTAPSRAGMALKLVHRTRAFYPCRTEEI